MAEAFEVSGLENLSERVATGSARGTGMRAARDYSELGNHISNKPLPECFAGA